MDAAWWALTAIVVSPAAIWTLLSVLIYMNVNVLSRPEQALKAVGLHTNFRFREAVDRHAGWAQEDGFDTPAEYRVQSPGAVVYAAVWPHVQQPMFMCIYFTLEPTPRVVYDLVTVLDEERNMGLTTTNSPDGLMFPSAPGNYRQAFLRAPLGDLWQRHIEAEVYLFQQLNVQPKPLRQGPHDLLCDAMGRQMNHIRSHLMWPLRGPWWYFRRHRLANQSVEEQFTRGEARVPGMAAA